MKQILALVLAVVLCMTALTGCSRDMKDKNQTQNQTTTPPTSQETTPPVSDTTPTTPEPEKENPNNPMDNITEDMKDAALKAETTLEDIIMNLGEEMGITMPTKLDETTLKDTFGIEPEWVEEYYGEYAAANTSADHLLAFKVKESHIEDVKKALEARREAIVQGFEESLVSELDKARNATIVEKGNYIFFVIAGDANADLDKEVNKAKDIIESYFE